MAFIPNKMQEPVELKRSRSPQMLCFDVAQIRPESRIEFDLHLYMPLNKKFLRYFAKGHTVIEEQLQKLTSLGQKTLHIDADEAYKVRRYFMQVYLNDHVATALATATGGTPAINDEQKKSQPK